MDPNNSCMDDNILKSIDQLYQIDIVYQSWSTFRFEYFPCTIGDTRIKRSFPRLSLQPH